MCNRNAENVVVHTPVDSNGYTIVTYDKSQCRRPHNRALTHLVNKHSDENEWRHFLPTESSVSRHITIALRRM